MRVKLSRDSVEMDVKNLRIILDEDTEFSIQLNNAGQLVLNKVYYGEGESSLTIMPSVSNEIRLK